jgi:hydroxypyruvate reductase
MTITKSSFQCNTLNKHPHGDEVKRILTAAIQSVEPGAAIQQFIKRENEFLWINEHQLSLSSFKNVYIIAFGKAAGAMADAMADLLGESLTAGWVVTKHAYVNKDSRIQSVIGGHPVPDANSLRAGEMLVNACGQFKAEDLVFCLISGGGSALVTAPYESISLVDMQTLTSQLLACGARIDEINCLRRHLDRVKGGGLAKLASPARMFSLILSDVVNSPLEAIASGATAPDPSNLVEAIEVLNRYHLTDQVPGAILEHLKNGPETPKPGDEVFEKVENLLVASNELAAQAAARQAVNDGYKIELLGDDWQGEAREVAETLCKKLISTVERPLCLIAGGETTVTIQGKGKGGRNQELALAAVPMLAGHPDLMLVTLATDGEDGPTDAAGAVVTGETKYYGLKLGLDAALFLANNDAYHYFQALDDLLKPGPSGTNVNDLTFLFRF